MRFGEVERAIILAGYAESFSKPNSSISTGELFDKYVIEPADGWVHKIVADLGRRGLIYGKGVMGDERSQPILLTASGMREAENLIDQGTVLHERITQKQEEKLEVPAADRVVRLDHNSAEFVSAIEKSRSLAAHLHTANDIGNLSKDQATAAAHEVSQIAETLEQDIVRPLSLWNRSIDVLRWIGSQAAAALIGAAALALLTLLASLLGFSF